LVGTEITLIDEQDSGTADMIDPVMKRTAGDGVEIALAVNYNSVKYRPVR
jgi:hypothetical protein